MDFCELRKKLNITRPIPARVYAYANVCRDVKRRAMYLQNEVRPAMCNLPFVSSIIQKYSYDGAVKTHWGFLKY